MLLITGSQCRSEELREAVRLAVSAAPQLRLKIQGEVSEGLALVRLMLCSNPQQTGLAGRRKPHCRKAHYQWLAAEVGQDGRGKAVATGPPWFRRGLEMVCVCVCV